MKAKKRDLTQEQLMGLFDYDHCKGRLLRRCFSNGLYIGLEIAGCKSNNGYRYVEISGITYLEHRLIWVYLTGVFPKDQLDHINKNRSDNRFSNLREVGNSENQRNTTLRKSNKTGIMGVHTRSDNGKWSARINHNGGRYTLGSFDDFFEACCARKSAEARFGYHKSHGKQA
jgi:hypothetical protein